MFAHSIRTFLALSFVSLCLLLSGCGGGGSQANNSPVPPKPKTLTQVSVSPQTLTLAKGTNHQMSAMALFSDGSQQDITSTAAWSANPAASVSVTTGGQATAMAVGTGQISAKYQGMTGNASITVTAAALSSIAVSPNQSSVPVGVSEQLSAMGTFTDGSTMDLTGTVTWTATPATSVALNGAGMLKGMAVGTAQVSAQSQGVTGQASVTVMPPALVSIAVTPNQSDVPVASTEQLTATGSYTDGSAANITALATWSTIPAAFATVNATGMVSGISVGNVQVSAAYQGKVGQALVSVPNLIFITVTPNPSSLPKGTDEQLTATGLYSDGFKSDLTQLALWQTNPASTATINDTGALKGMAVGPAHITAQYQGITGNASVTVAPPVLVSIAVTPGWSAVAAGASEQLTATGTFSDGSTKDITPSAQWASYQATIASVGTHGNTTGNSMGTTGISAASGTVIGGAEVTVLSAAIASLEVVPNTATMGVGGSQQFLAIAHLKNGATQDVSGDVVWSSVPSNILSLTSGGMAGAVQVGSTKLTASAGGVSNSAAVQVVPELAVNYFDLAAAQAAGSDGTIRVTNPGLTGADLCAMFYVYDQNQELSECCGCVVSPNGLRTLSLVSDFNSDPLTGTPPARGVIQMVPSDPAANPTCNPSSLAPRGVVLGWSSNVQLLNNGTFQISEEKFSFAPLVGAEQQELASQCGALQQLGSGQGVCTCGTGD